MKIWEKVGISPEQRTFKPSELFPDNSFVGIEIEVENAHYVKHGEMGSFWEIVNDGSLRNSGIEFRLVVPLYGEDVINSLKEFSAFVTNYSLSHHPLESSERTSVHIHLDVREEEMEDFKKILVMLISFKEVLLKLSGERSDSKYCIPITFAANARENLVGLLAGRGEKNHFYMEKYSDFNLNSILQRGSLEVRFHEGTLDGDRILTWIRILSFIKKRATQINSPLKKIPSFVSIMGIDNFISSIFPEDLKEIIMYNGYEIDLLRGLRQAQEIIFDKKIKDADRLLDNSIEEECDILSSFIEKRKQV